MSWARCVCELTFRASLPKQPTRELGAVVGGKSMHNHAAGAQAREKNMERKSEQPSIQKKNAHGGSKQRSWGLGAEKSQ